MYYIIVSESRIDNSIKPIDISSKYMNLLADYIISGSFIEIQETIGQGLSMQH